MNQNTAIKAENLCKSYVCTMSNRNSGKARKQVFQALKNINFEVQKGEIIALCGSNGAGKSTLLKILSRITAPTSGIVMGQGKVSSLLETGMGYQGDLTGLENVYLNGAMLGMRKSEIDRCIDNIVQLSGLTNAIQLPVKKYSSGMHMRLAFSAAVHLATDILILDEVMAIGDHSFQQFALQKIMEVNRNEGKTIIIVSHNESQLDQLSNRKITLVQGEIAE